MINGTVDMTAPKMVDDPKLEPMEPVEANPDEPVEPAEAGSDAADIKQDGTTSTKQADMSTEATPIKALDERDSQYTNYSVDFDEYRSKDEPNKHSIYQF